jgi:hypothetical protein
MSGEIVRGGGGDSRLLPDEKKDSDADRCGDEGPEEDRVVVGCAVAEEEDREEDADDGARGIHAAVDPEPPSARLLRGAFGNEGIAWSRPDPLAKTVHHASREDPSPARGQEKERLAENGGAVARDGKSLPPREAVRCVAGEEPEDRGEAFCDPLDQSEDGGTRAQRGGQEKREERIDHLARHVREERGQSQQKDIAHGERKEVRSREAACRTFPTPAGRDRTGRGFQDAPAA